MTEFLFIRHGESVMNTSPELVGGRSNESPLTEKGREQARLVGVYLKNEPDPVAIFGSGAIRTNETAQIALAAAGITLPLFIDERLLELSQGEFEGANRALAYTKENKERFAIATPDGKFPGGESTRDVQERMRQFISEQHSTYPEGRILVFSHGLTIRMLAGAIKAQSKQEIIAERTDNVSLTMVQKTYHETTVHYIGKNVIPEYT